jgi:hypothetical protein
MKRAGIWLGLVAWASLTVAGCGGPDTSPKPSFVSVDNGRGQMIAKQVAAPKSSASASLQNVPAAPLQAKAYRYFVEFRSRYALSYGHSFVIFGRVNDAGQVVDREVAGLHPTTYAALPYIVGHVVPVPAETGASDGDLEDAYRSASWRVMLNEAQYGKAVASIRKIQKSSPVWNGMTYNCNAFVANVARSMGYKTPNILLRPQQFMTELREMNTTSG